MRDHMKKWLSLILIVLLISTLSSCKNKSEKYNDFIKDYESPDNYVFYDRDKYIKQGIEYQFEDIADQLVESHDLRSNSRAYVNNQYVLGNKLYFQFIHYQTPDCKGETAAHDQSLVVIDLTTNEYELLKTFTDIPGDNTRTILGLLDDTYYVFIERNTIKITNIKTDEDLYEVTLDLSLGKSFDYQDGILYIYKDNRLTVWNLNDLTETNHTISEPSEEVDITYPYLVLFQSGHVSKVFDLNTTTEVTSDDYNAYVETVGMIFYQNQYSKPILSHDEIMIGHLTLKLEGAVIVVPILTELVLLDLDNPLYLYFTEYHYINEYSFYIGITHDESAMLFVDRLYTMLFKYEQEVGLTYIGYFDEASDIKVIELSL